MQIGVGVYDQLGEHPAAGQRERPAGRGCRRRCGRIRWKPVEGYAQRIAEAACFRVVEQQAAQQAGGAGHPVGFLMQAPGVGIQPVDAALQLRAGAEEVFRHVAEHFFGQGFG